MFKKATLLTAVAGLAFAGASSAAVISWTDAKAHNESGAGGISSLSDRDEIDGQHITNPDDPSLWTATARGWPNDWQGNGPLSGATNGKVGWVSFDFGSVQNLDEVYIWNVREATAPARRVNTYNIYYSNSPTVAPASGSSVDYDFSSGGWTQLVGTRSLTAATNGPDAANGVETLGVSAQYIGLEFITYGGDASRVGLAEVVFTDAIPEPSSLALLGLGGLLIARRRRN